MLMPIGTPPSTPRRSARVWRADIAVVGDAFAPFTQPYDIQVGSGELLIRRALNAA